MGDIADQIVDSFFSFEFEDNYEPSHTDLSKYEWKTKEGQILLMHDMETKHIENCIKLLERTGGTKDKIDAFKEVLRERGEL